MKIIPLVLVALFATAAIPASAEPMLIETRVYLDTNWSLGAVSGTCTSMASITRTAMLDGHRALVEIQTLPRGITTSIGERVPRSECALEITSLPGFHVNPCQVMKGEVPSATVTAASDPYFYYYGGAWYKTINFADGGYVQYSLLTWYGPALLSGQCASGSATGSWGSRWGGWIAT